MAYSALGCTKRRGSDHHISLLLFYPLSLSFSFSFSFSFSPCCILQAGKRDNGSTEMRVTEAVPLLHSHLALAPALDGAFALVDQYCVKKGLGIVGYYHANAHHMHNDLTPLARRIADKVAEVVRDTKKWVPVVCMQVDNESLDGMAEIIGHGEGNPAQHTGVRLLQKSQSGWSPVDKDVGEIVGCDDGSSQIFLCEQVMVFLKAPWPFPLLSSMTSPIHLSLFMASSIHFPPPPSPRDNTKTFPPLYFCFTSIHLSICISLSLSLSLSLPPPFSLYPAPLYAASDCTTQHARPFETIANQLTDRLLG
jgi:hypothetical protein